MSTRDEIEQAVRSKLAADSTVVVEDLGGGHFAIDAQSDSFNGKSRVEQQRLVYSAISHLMAGNAAPVHAIDRLLTRTK